MRAHRDSPRIQLSTAAYTATDPEDDNNAPPKPLKWSLGGADGGRFNISNERSRSTDLQGRTRL